MSEHNDIEDITKEMIDYEPSNPTIAAYAGDNASSDAPPDGRSRRREYSASAAAGDGPQQLRRTSRAIGDSLANIAAGRSLGEHPALDALIGPSTANATRVRRQLERRPIPAGARYGENHRSKQGAHESAAYAPYGRYIADVRPPVKERLAIVEHDLEAMHEKVHDAYTVAIQAASNDDMHERLAGAAFETNRRFNSVHKRLDTEVLPRIEKLENKRVLRDWVGGIALAVSIIYSIVLTVRALLIR